MAMEGKRPSVSVIIPAKDAADTIGNALTSIAEQTYDNIVEVVVAAADAATANVAAEHGAIVVRNPKGSTPAGLNLAIAASSGEVLVRCDAHAVLPSGYVSRVVETLVRTGADNVGGMQVPVGKTFWERAIASAMASRLGSGDARYRMGGAEGPAETVYLGSFPRRTLEQLGGYDEAFTRGQDYELNHRIINSGGVVYLDPELEVEYRPRNSLKALGRQYFGYGRSKRRMARKHPGSLRLRQVLPPIATIGIVGTLIASWWLPWLAAIPATYLVAVSASAWRAPGGLKESIATGSALVVMHFAWGAGYLAGVE